MQLFIQILGILGQGSGVIALGLALWILFNHLGSIDKTNKTQWDKIDDHEKRLNEFSIRFERIETLMAEKFNSIEKRLDKFNGCLK